MSAAEIALKPCPFCNGAARVAWYDGFPSVRCDVCNCGTGMYESGDPNDAVKDWNRRA
ncbi:Restriction alleviation protein Lar [uncultured Caudovirales phage]|uniref:Restriction alleviation protein Lar n=1 Tax=uncultured Caudovirales phage TaxID=2100421 RepID=A0A6J7X3K5_9CAUD|nr:Restriction alleviation protein Lar [uncultured Caudovirales phage]